MYLSDEQKANIRGVLDEILDGDVDRCVVTKELDGTYDLYVRRTDTEVTGTYRDFTLRADL
ncbi:hypothetical protein ACP2W8_20200 [Bacillus subtilis]|uniref:hypothetical protein n=1 Tax=Bacillus subtilis TaxID=1423 RepID=UPI003CE9239E